MFHPPVPESLWLYPVYPVLVSPTRVQISLQGVSLTPAWVVRGSLHVPSGVSCLKYPHCLSVWVFKKKNRRVEEGDSHCFVFLSMRLH